MSYLDPWLLPYYTPWLFFFFFSKSLLYQFCCSQSFHLLSQYRLFYLSISNLFESAASKNYSSFSKLYKIVLGDLCNNKEWQGRMEGKENKKRNGNRDRQMKEERLPLYPVFSFVCYYIYSWTLSRKSPWVVVSNQNTHFLTPHSSYV